MDITSHVWVWWPNLSSVSTYNKSHTTSKKLLSLLPISYLPGIPYPVHIQPSSQLPQPFLFEVYVAADFSNSFGVVLLVIAGAEVLVASSIAATQSLCVCLLLLYCELVAEAGAAEVISFNLADALMA